MAQPVREINLEQFNALTEIAELIRCEVYKNLFGESNGWTDERLLQSLDSILNENQEKENTENSFTKNWDVAVQQANKYKGKHRDLNE
jgi:hypothetical protein|tara:strand:+ start:266 stop:529 length:264 start_codon:yes stop_codon:yes gene_type:complete